MKKLDFNKDWICRCLTREEGEVHVNLPHDAMISEARSKDSHGEGNIAWFIGGDYEYRKVFEAPDEWKEKKLLMEFEGVYRNAEVILNGEKVAYRPYGYTNFYVDLTEHLNYGEQNEVRVIAHNSDQPNSRWYSGTGLYRPVNLYLGEPEHILVNGIKIKTLSAKNGVIEIRIRTSAPGKGNLQIKDQLQTVITLDFSVSDSLETVLQVKVPDAKLWDTEHPNLYLCHVVFEKDEAETTFGIRTLKWNKKGLLLNGKRIILRGACIHHDNGLLGACAFPEAEERKVRILKDNGYNALRSAHNPCSKAILDACDRLGMLMMDEYVDAWYIHKTAHDYVDYMMDWWKEDLRDMVDKDYNHPSVVMYSTGNEVSETAQPKGIQLTGDMTRYLHNLDDTRPVTCGINIFFNFLSSMGFGVYSDDKAQKNADAAKKSGNEKKKAVGSEFYNRLACLMGDYFMKIGATLYPCDVKTRDAFANMDIAGYNYGISRYRHDLKKYPKRLILGSETFCKDAYAFWEIAKKNNRIIGDFVWPGMDYIGEVGEGCVEYADYKYKDESTSMTGGCGRVDLLGKPRAEAAYTKVAFEQEIGPRMAVLPVYEKEKLNINGWTLTKAMESWSWNGCEGMAAIVEVHARAAEVELRINGKSVGRKKVNRKNCRTIFKTVYESGTIEAVSYDGNGKVIGNQQMKSAAAGTVLQIQPEQSVIKPDGLGFIWLRYTDPDGIWKPMEKHCLSVKVENGRLAGLGSACPFVQGSYNLDGTRTYFGEAMAIVQADGSGPVKVSVTDEHQTKSITIPVSNR